MNKFFIYKIATLILLFIFISHVSAQQIYDGKIVVTNVQAKQEEGLLSVSMNMDMSKLRIDNQRMLTLTPVLVGSNNRIEFPEVVVSGNVRYKAYERSMGLGKNSVTDPAYSVLRSKDTKEMVVYEQLVPFEPWMADAQLYIKEDLCGCGGHTQVINEEFITGVSLAALPKVEPVEQPKPIVPIVRERTEQRTITLNFHVGKTIINEDYMDNRSQLSQLKNISNELKANENITALKIEGYASPEGGFRRNQELSKGRVEALVRYLSENHDLPKNISYTTNYVGEDWSGLISMVEASSIDHKEEILSIIKNTEDIALRKRKLEQLDGGKPYRYMLTNFYPKLRKVEYRISYIVKE